MKLYSFLYPKSDICNETEMYYRGYGFVCDNNHIVFEKGGIMSSSTYFNGISLNKWYDNTNVNNIGVQLQLKGRFKVSLVTADIDKNEVVYSTECEEEFYSDEIQTLALTFKSKKGIGFLKLECLEQDSIMESADYTAEVDESSINTISVAVGICTFKREEFIKDNLQRLSAAINDRDSALHDKLDVYVSDNGQTLPMELNGDHIHIVYNPNYGGAGGFTRTLIEAKRSGKRYTNFIFLDDDIVLDTHAIAKNIIFLSVLKEEKKASVIGGAMFSIDDRYLQFESASKWQDAGFKFNRRDVDLRQLHNVVLNEQQYDVNYNAWCYCCIPFDIVKDNNLPLPIFFHMDDVEYGLRNALPIITLNGINVWHLYKKGLVPAKNVYYDTRNKLIMLSELNPPEAIKVAWNYFASFTTEALKYHYAKTINAYDGILDFCKGFDWFRKTNTLHIHQKLYNNVSWKDIRDESLFEKARFSINDVRSRKTKLSIMFNQIGVHFATKYIFNDNSCSDTKDCNKIIVVNRKENKYIVYKKNLLLAARCFFKRKTVIRALKKKLPKAIQEYNHRINEVQSISFWNNYLGLDSKQAQHKKVLFVASDNDSTSGAFRSMTVLARLMKERCDLNVKVLLPKVGDGTQLLKENGIEYTIIPSEDWIVKLIDDKLTIHSKHKRINQVNKKALPLITKYLKEEGFDLVHINTSYHYVAAIAAHKLGIPVVWHLREFLEEDQQRRIINRRYGYRLINQSTRIVAISDSIFNKYDKIFDKNKMVRIYNGIDPTSFVSKDHVIFAKDVPHFLCVGVIDEYKGQGELVEALGKYKKKYNGSFVLTLVGNNKGAYMQVINRLIDEYDLKNNVIIAGRRNDVNELLKETDITFVCSKAEAFGRVTVEAMLAKSLVIGARNAGTQELIEQNNDGLLYSPGNTDELCEYIHFALTNTEQMRKYAARGQEKCLELFNASLNCDNIFEQYKAIWEGDK